MQFRLACNEIRSIQSLLRIVRLVSSSLMIARKRIPTVLSSDSLAEFSTLLDNPCEDGFKAFDRRWLSVP